MIGERIQERRKIGVGHFEATQKMRELISQVLTTGRISYGPMSKHFERRFAILHDSKYGVLSNSGTSSLQVALQALKEIHGWEDGDEVIVPAITFVATVNIVLHNRMKPILVDIEPDYYGIDCDLIEYAITDKTRAIIPVHLFGMPCGMEYIWNIAKSKKPKLQIIEDSCESMFAIYRGNKVGSMGDIGCFSMYVAHLLATGVGGIAITKNSDYAAKMRSLVNHGRDGIYISIDDDDNVEAEVLSEIISRRFNFKSIGHSFRITELEAALALAQLDDWKYMITQRIDNAAYLHAGLQHIEALQLPEVRPGASHSYMMFPIVLNYGNKWELCNYLEQNGIETREMLRLTDQPVYSDLWNPDDYPVAQWINAQGFYVACHNGLSKEDLDYMVDVISTRFTVL